MVASSDMVLEYDLESLHCCYLRKIAEIVGLGRRGIDSTDLDSSKESQIPELAFDFA